MHYASSVGAQLQQSYRLRVLRISLNTHDSAPLAVFSLSLFTSLHQREDVALLTATLPELGFAPDVAGRGRLPQAFTLPPRIVRALKSWLCRGADAAQPLWLRFDAPTGLLAAVAWEQLLQPPLQVPVVRLPYQALCPHIPARGRDVVICLSGAPGAPGAPDGGAWIEQLLAQLPADLPEAPTFHLFADAPLQTRLLALKQQFAGRIAMKLYRPRRQARGRAVGANGALQWIAREMTTCQQSSVDVVHFVCQGERSADQGRLVLSAEPWSKTGTAARAVLSAEKIVSFLNDVGAWAVGLSAVGRGTGAASMRLLQAQIAMLRPGPVFVHDLKADDGKSVDSAYRFLFAPTHPAPASAALSLCCHPILLAEADTDAASHTQLTSFTLADKLADLYQASAPPAWLVSAQRQLEMLAGELAHENDPVLVDGQQSARDVLFAAVDDYFHGVLPAAALQGGHHASRRHRH
ncbi:hypothetical protein [Massilia sp. DWR3-1-1]|uniref:hypothetical protein n=1 Tax=Massilia sp. DWR3-1-1 TaxID=2804559 RepID=UPI003CF81A69